MFIVIQYQDLIESGNDLMTYRLPYTIGYYIFHNQILFKLLILNCYFSFLKFVSVIILTNIFVIHVPIFSLVTKLLIYFILRKL